MFAVFPTEGLTKFCDLMLAMDGKKPFDISDDKYRPHDTMPSTSTFAEMESDVLLASITIEIITGAGLISANSTLKMRAAYKPAGGATLQGDMVISPELALKNEVDVLQNLVSQLVRMTGPEEIELSDIQEEVLQDRTNAALLCARDKRPNNAANDISDSQAGGVCSLNSSEPVSVSTVVTIFTGLYNSRSFDREVDAKAFQVPHPPIRYTPSQTRSV